MCKTERVKTMLMIHERLTHKSLLNGSSIIYNVTTVSNDVPSLKCSHISSRWGFPSLPDTHIHYLYKRSPFFLCVSKQMCFLHDFAGT